MANPKLLDPIPELDRQYAGLKPTCVFNARTSAEARQWQKRVRPLLADALGFVNDPKVPLQPKVLETVDRGSYVRKKVLLHTGPETHTPVYLLIPKDAPRPMPVVLALHGHGYGVKDIVGLWEDGTERYAPDGIHKDFGTALAQRGFLVAAPEIACFGERQTDYSHMAAGMAPSSCHHVGTYAMMLGKSAIGLRVRDGMRVLDYLETLREADTSRVGTMGLSGGGMHAFYSTALDLRIKACVISGYFCDWRKSILAMLHCTCNFVPGLLNLGELHDLAGLIAPRPCLVENGNMDLIFPIGDVKKTIAKARPAWEVFQASGVLQTDYFEGRHQINGPKAYAFLREHLK